MTNRYKRIILSACSLLMAWLFIFSSGGPGPGYTGAPFDGQTCGSCHGGGSFGTALNVQLLSSGVPVTTYLPGQSYTLRIAVAGTSPELGFQTTAAYQTSNVNINNWGTLPPNTANVAGGGHNYIQHSTPLTVSTIDIPWTAPVSTNTVMFYTAANRVNGNNSTTGDQVVSNSISIQSGCAPINLSPGTLPAGTAGTAYNQAVSQSGATGTPAWAVSTGTLPPGLTLNTTNGQITGTPTTNGTYNFTITVTGGNGCTGSQAYSIVINCPTITLNPATLPGGTVGTAYNQSVTQSGGTGTYNYTLTGTLPPGVTFSNGTFSGTPTTAGTYNVTVTATGNGTCTGSQSYSIVIGCPTVTVSPATIPTMTVGTAITPQTYTQTGAVGTVTWSATGLPAGVTINPTTGQLTGTPTAAGTFNITITATGNGPCSGSQVFNNTVVSCPTITVNPASLPAMTVGTPFSQSLSQTGGTGTLTWAVTAGTIPAGLTLNTTTGAITGTPTTSGSYCFTVTVTGTGPCSGSRQYCGTVNCPPITINPGTIASNIVVGSTYSQQFTQTGGTGTFNWTSSGNIPTGLTLSGTGLLSGTPTTNGSYTFTITATNTTSGCTASQSYTVTVGCDPVVITPSTMPNVQVNTPYNQTVSQTGNFGTWTYTVTSGTIPTGLTFNNGAITGTTTQAGTYTFTVTGVSQYGCTGSQSYTIVVGCPTIALTPGTVPNAPIGQAYNQPLTVTGSTNTFTFAVSSGMLPTGITLSTGGVLSGTPTVAGSYTFTVTATDNFGCSTSTTYTIVVACPTIVLSPGTLPPGNVGFAYSQTFTVTGSTNTFTYTSTGALPPGLTLTTGGILAGTPTTAGTYNFTVTATDSYGCTTQTTYTVIISPCAPLTISPTSLPDDEVNTTYTQNMTQTGGTGTITWSVTGTLPPGITINPTTGVVSGTSTATGTYTFTIVATDGIGCTGTLTDTIDITCPNIILSPNTVVTDTAGEPYNQAISQFGSTSFNITYSVTNGSLPPGITLSSNGVLSGTSNALGSYTFTITMVDEFGCTQSITYTLDVVCPVITIDQTTLPGMNTNTPYSTTLTQTGGTPPFTYTLSGGALPGGITLAANGQLSGTTGDYGNHSFTVTVTDDNGCTGTQTFSIFVDWPVSVKGVVAEQETVVLMPNIVTGSTVALITAQSATKVEIRVVDITGKEVYRTQAAVTAGANKIPLDMSNLAAGAYTLHIKPLAVKPVKFIKQ